MFRWFKNSFVPHDGNDNQPHVLRLETTVTLLSLTLLIEVVFLAQALFVLPSSHYFSSIVANALIGLTNTERTASHDAALADSPLLDKAASLKAEDMAAHGYFAHTSPDGKTPWYWFAQVGYQFSYAGENLAVNFVDSQDVMNAWMQSPAHRENILDARFTQIGVGVAQGTYEGRSAVFVVQLFGTPAPAAQAVAEESTLVPIGGAETAPQPVAAGSGAAVEGAAVAPAPAASVPVSFVETLLASPRSMNTFLYVVLGTIVLLGLVLTVFVRVRVQHPPLIAHGAMLLLLIGSLLVLNQYLALAHAAVF